MTVRMLNIQQVDLRTKRVLIRPDLNVPIQDGKVYGKERIRAALDTVRYAMDQNAAVLIMSHLGRPKEGVFDQRFSMEPVAHTLAELLEYEVEFVSDWIDGVELQPGQVALLENTRFLEGEASSDPALSKRIAKLCDVFVFDAFGGAHREQASLTGVIDFAEIVCSGLLFQHEVDSLARAMNDPTPPFVSIVGGAKIQGKLQALRRLSVMSDHLIVGGGIANTFLAAQGFNVGQSLYEPDLKEVANEIVTMAANSGCEIPLPQDVVVAPSLSQAQSWAEKRIDEVSDDDMILDIGSETQRTYQSIIEKSETIIWNGPVGAFEVKPFDSGTRCITEAVASSSAFSVAGGGDTLAALEKYNKLDEISCVSTGGGAFLEYVQGNGLPAIRALENHAEKRADIRAYA